METEKVDGRDFTWVGAFVHSNEQNENIFAGAIRFPGSKLKFSGYLSSFVEVYERPWEKVPLSIPTLVVSVDNLRINGQQVRPRRIWAEFEVGVPNHGRVSLSSEYKKLHPNAQDLSTAEDAYVMTIGAETVERKSNRVLLLPKE